MRRKITSAVKIDNENAKLKIGTIDRKNPTVVYFEGGFYIKPTIKKNNYLSIIEEVKEELNEIVKNHVRYSDKMKNDYMFFTEIAEDRIMFNKKSFMTFQLYIKPNESVLNENSTFKTILPILTEEESLVNDFKKILERNGFVTSKTKS